MSERAQRLSLAAAVIIAGLFTVLDLRHADVVDRSALWIPVTVVAVVLAIGLGGMWPWPRSLLGLVPLVAATTANSSTFNPFLATVAVGGWLCGVAVASQRRIGVELEARSRELDEEQELFAVQSVRYERARIAREMHDVVAHCVSLIVVQANAGAHLAATQPSAVVETFDSIREIAAQARREVEHLDAVLDSSRGVGTSDVADLLEAVVGRAAAAGLSVECLLSGDLGALPVTIGETVRRLVQESMTNAVKHSPGSSVRIGLRGSEATVTLDVENTCARGPGSGLADTGGGRGLAGMRDRVLACGGRFDAGASPDGTWRVTAVLPRQARPVPTEVFA